MSIIYQSRREYGILGDYHITVYSCSNCKHKLTYEDRTFNRCPYCGETYEILKSSALEEFYKKQAEITKRLEEREKINNNK